ncbi:MAG: hypothetical protein ACO3AV_10015 [Ilumatobacteraceae bacterium]
MVDEPVFNQLPGAHTRPWNDRLDCVGFFRLTSSVSFGSTVDAANPPVAVVNAMSDTSWAVAPVPRVSG